MNTRRNFLAGLAAPGLMLGMAPTARALTDAGPFEPDARAGDAAVFAAARAQFLIPEGVTYCNTGTLGAMPREVVDAVTGGIRRLEVNLAAWPYEKPEGEPLTGYQQLLDVRAAAGRFVNASAAEIALTQNATMGMNFLANGLDLAAGDEVVSTDQEHGGGISPWRLLAKRRGIVVTELKLEPVFAEGPEGIVKLFESAMTPRTKVVMFSHITSGLGALLPARELCAMARGRGALAIVDGAQAVGQIQVDVGEMGCDAYVASPHKWMLAPKGTGFMYLRRDVQDRFAGNGHIRGGDPSERHRDKAEPVGHLGVRDERECAEAGQVKRDTGKPPWEPVPAGEEIANVFHPAPEIQSDQSQEQEVSRDDDVIGCV